MPQGILPAATRVAPGLGLGPVAPASRPTPLGSCLAQHAPSGADPARNFSVEIEEGLLICAECGRWYPIIGQLPEILPDHLRNAERDLDVFRSVAPGLPEDVRTALARFQPRSGSADEGAHYKAAEMSITKRVDDPQFFGPGYTSPFNLWNPEFTLYLIGLFGAVLPVLGLRKGDVLIDSGNGYAWTTEWFHRAGVPAVGIDISRVYPEIGIKRMGASRPHLVVGDVEHLPLQDACADAVLAYESFHHIPDRRKAMAGYDRVLRPAGRVVLAEPGGEHEQADVSQDVMKKYGILERGMELGDVRGYAAGTSFTAIEEILLGRFNDRDTGLTVTRDVLRSRSLLEGNLFKLSRAGAADPRQPALAQRIGPAIKRRVDRLARKLGRT